MLTNVVYRELANGLWFVLNFSYLIFLVQFYADLRWFGPHKYDMPVHRRRRVEALLLFTMLYFVAASLRAGYVWLLLLTENARLGVFYSLQQLGIIMIIAAAIGLVAVLLLMRKQSDKTWGSKVWVAAGVSAVLIPIVTHFAFNMHSRDYVYYVLIWWWSTGNWDPAGIN